MMTFSSGTSYYGMMGGYYGMINGCYGMMQGFGGGWGFYGAAALGLVAGIVVLVGALSVAVLLGAGFYVRRCFARAWSP